MVVGGCVKFLKGGSDFTHKKDNIGRIGKLGGGIVLKKERYHLCSS